MKKKIGIIGGTFNPVHLGHLLIAETAREQFNLQQVVWIPTYCPPHKLANLVNFQHRWEMVQRAISDHPHFIASDVDYQQGGTSYAATTLQALQATSPQTDWHWIIGTDAFKKLPQWQSRTPLINYCTWLIAPRSSHPAQTIGDHVATQLAAQGEQLHWYVLEMPHIEISSSLIREYCSRERSIRYLVPDSVRDYITRNGLYINAVNAPRPITED